MDPYRLDVVDYYESVKHTELGRTAGSFTGWVRNSEAFHRKNPSGFSRRRRGQETERRF